MTHDLSAFDFPDLGRFSGLFSNDWKIQPLVFQGLEKIARLFCVRASRLPSHPARDTISTKNDIFQVDLNGHEPG
jgi:hypothetical protein